MTDLDLAAIRQRAEAAAEARPGPWAPGTTGIESGDHWHVLDVDTMHALCHIAAQDGSNEDEREPLARHIAGMDPTTTLALLDMLEKAGESK